MCQLKLKLKIPHDIGKSTGIKTKERKEQNYLQDEYICIYFLNIKLYILRKFL